MKDNSLLSEVNRMGKFKAGTPKKKVKKLFGEKNYPHTPQLL